MATPAKRKSSRILGIPRDGGDKPPETLEVNSDTSVWEIYNYHVGKVESEDVKDWSDTLNTLLVFAGLYSAVLTAFITESIQLLQEDPTDTTRDILLHISSQLATPSTPAFDATANPFVAPEWALQVNYCFFVSLLCALITALAAVLALQWVGSYDRRLNPSSEKICAWQRQFRMDGARQWKMKHIIGTLPNLIFISLLLFFVGLAQWLWHIHYRVAVIIIAGATLGILFYAITTLASIIAVDAPFRTPASRYLPMWFGLALQFMRAFFQSLSLIFRLIFKGGADTTLPISTVQEPNDESRWRKLLKGISEQLESLTTLEPLEDREQETVKKSPTIRLDSLFWLARSISIEPYQRHSLMIIIRAIARNVDRSKQKLYSTHKDAEIWTQIFIELHRPFTKIRKWIDYSPEDVKNAALFVRGLSSIGQGFLRHRDFQKIVREIYGSYGGFDDMCRIMREWKEWRRNLTSSKPESENRGHEKDDESDNEDEGNAIQRTPEAGNDRPTLAINRVQPGKTDRYKPNLANLEKVLRDSKDFPLEFIIATLVQAKQQIKQQAKQTSSKRLIMAVQEPLDLIAKHLHIGHDKLRPSALLPIPVLELVQEFIISVLSGKAVASFDPSTYSDTVKQYLEKPQADSTPEKVISAHEALIEQTIVNLAQINATRLSNAPRIQEALIKLQQLAQVPLPSPFRLGKKTIIFVLRSMLDTKTDLWSQSNRVYTARAISSLLHIRDSAFNGESWIVWWLEILPAFNEFIDENNPDTETIIIEHSQMALSAHLPHQAHFTYAEIARLSEISHIGVRLLATTVTQSPGVAMSVLSNIAAQKYRSNWTPGGVWTPSEAWTQFIDVCFYQLEEQALKDETIVRAFTVGSSAGLFDRIYDINISPHLKSPPELFKYLSFPVLPALFRHSSNNVERTMRVLETICLQKGFSTEFFAARGFNWLPTFISKHPYRFTEALSVIRQALSKCHTYVMCVAWINVTLACQEIARLAISKGDVTALELREFIAANLHLLTIDFEERKDPGMGTGDQAIHIAISSNTQERPAAADTPRVIPENAENGDVNIIEGDGKSKSDTAPAREWTPEEKALWEQLVKKVIQGFDDISTMVRAPTSSTIIQAPASSSETSRLPRKDLTLLRDLTLNGSDSVYEYIFSTLDDTLKSEDLSREYFRDPVLGKILQMDSENIGAILKTLVSISGYAWFAFEFSTADGPRLLPLRLEPLYLEEVAEVITKALSTAHTYKDVLQWISLANHCLWSVGLGLQGSDSQKSSMMSYANDSLEPLSTLITRLDQKWHHDRRLESNWTPEAGEASTEAVFKCDAGHWSPAEWEAIEDLTQALVSGGLQRGYIMPAPSAEVKRFSRDPDGLCPYSRL